jgi:soluble lytic murein transglycosylase-like protein
MRGIGRTLVRLPAARALFAGAALLAGASTQRTMAQPTPPSQSPAGDEVALAIPRLALPGGGGGGGGVGLPQPLPPSQAAQIRRIFALQAKGDIPAALRASAELDSGSPLADAMLGHLLADRYLGPFTRPSAEQLRAWLERYPDLPDAAAIHRLLVVRLPVGETAPPLPPGFTAATTPEPAPVPEETESADSALTRNPDLDRSVWAAARARGAIGVEHLLRHANGLTPSYAAQLRGEAAQILFARNRDAEAFELAAAGVPELRQSGLRLPAQAAIAGYIAGLSAWRMERYADARTMFAAAWRSEITTPALKAASAYWTARAELRGGLAQGAAQRASVWLWRAAEQRRTFYGMLARRTLGLGLRASRVGPGERETLGDADLDAMAATPHGLRAFALLQVDQPARAAAELRMLWPAAKASRPLARAAMLVADAAKLTDLAMDFADLLAAADGRPREGLRFTVPRLRPAGGFTVDPAMVYGLARTESNFDPRLVSSAGARGLLQIMPETASFLTGARMPDLAEALHDPTVNLDLGQRYVCYLAGLDTVHGNLIRLIAAYNAGPGALLKWGARIRDHGDPLLFIEAIPIDETRAYVPRVLTYTWIYAARMSLPAPSLDELAAGEWPRFHALQATAPSLASLH